MLKWIPGPFKGLFNYCFIMLHTLFWCAQLYLLFFCKWISSNQQWRNLINTGLIHTAENWIRSNNLMMDLILDIKWELPDLSLLQKRESYFIICNHQTWTDIFVLQRVFLSKIPFIRFFIKKQLLWLPVLNLAWVAFDFPVMHRHSKEALAKNPQLRKKDFESTLKACARYENNPVTILNFLEGTRFTTQKHEKQKSPYQNLLIPKAGGFAFTVNVMDKKITHVLDVTLIYPEGRKTFWDFLCGRVHQINVKLTEREIPAELLAGDYFEDDLYREKIKLWVNTIWEDKDKILSTRI